MANEFNIKNGFISKGNSSVEGSLSANTIYIQSITSGTSVASLSIDSTGRVISGSTSGGGSGIHRISGAIVDTIITTANSVVFTLWQSTTVAYRTNGRISMQLTKAS